ncbi:HAMP domain-containing sensor histidine kinase [Magnetovibrio sp.]|uniref:sensor histidine kinase n=1 Tax=Magnetovibrio sp. TaxID=2024836 RepID=UPI002F92BE45
MVTSFNRVFKLASISLLATFVLAVIWEFAFEYPLFIGFGWVDEAESIASRWGHVAVIMIFATIAVVFLALLSIRLVRELKAKDETMRLKDEERMNFAADVAHELRTPLAVLRAHLDSLDDADTNFQLIQDVDRITRIVEQVLTKSRIEAIELGPNDKADLAEVASSMAAYLAPLVIKEGRSIEVVGAESPIIIKGNTFALEQALRNLVENAIKYSARGSTITIEVSQTPSIRVIDRGRGVPYEQREMIFERFHRADRRSGGSGLGLSIVRRVAEAHGGSVAIEDAPGGGSVFVLSFPRL